MRKKISPFFIIAVLFISIFSSPVSAEGFTFPGEDDLNTESVFMVSLDTGSTVYVKNPDDIRPVASLTKIMSYIVAYENFSQIENLKITVPQIVKDELEGTGSSLSGVIVGEELTGLQLLNLMMVPSGNDAALVLEKYGDSLEITYGEYKNNHSLPDGMSEISDDSILTFVDMMNLKAAELGCTNTNFKNSHGLHEEDHYSTARDMATISRYALTLPYFAEITSSLTYTLPPTNMSSHGRTLYSTNKMLSQYDDGSGSYYYMYATGIKTGSLNESGYCIAASGLYEGYSYVVICLGSPMRDEDGNYIYYHGEMVDAANLLRWAFLNLEMKTIALKGDLMGDLAIEYAWQKDRLQVVSGENVSTLLPKDVQTTSIIVNTDLPEKIQAPIKKGDIVGAATLSYAGDVVATVELIAAESVEKSDVMQTFQQGKAVLSSPWFLFIFAAIIFLLIIYVILIMLYRSKKKRLKKVRKYRDL